MLWSVVSLFFFFNDTATTEIYTLSLHDALPISPRRSRRASWRARRSTRRTTVCRRRDRKSTRLNSSHSQISYAVFCLKKKNDSEYPSHLALFQRTLADRKRQRTSVLPYLAGRTI